MAHRLDCPKVMQLCDEAFVLKCGAALQPGTQPKPRTDTWLTVTSVGKLYTLATSLQLPDADLLGLEQHCLWQSAFHQGPHLIAAAGLKVQCAAFLVRNFQDVAMEQQSASFDPQLTLFLEQFKLAFSFTRKTPAEAAIWKAVA